MCCRSVAIGRQHSVAVIPPVTAEATALSSRVLYPAFKRLVDIVLVLTLGIITLPLLLLLMALVRLTSRGPVIYSQTRVGRNHRPFLIYKLRTMFHDCERLTGPKWSTDNDPRVTPVGRFLRRAHLDELPQFWNILVGDMSLIGPRPERPEFVRELEKVLPRYAERLDVLPGLTGLAQVNLPPDVDEESVRRKLAFDLYYARNVGPWLDLRILVGTGLMCLGETSETLAQLFELRPGRLARVAQGVGDRVREPVGMVEPVPQPVPAWHES
jgi:lipopolysaccharide/colanic/teichoic acid biosynthesis glycosyltransferase